jgi:hypothetical protein
LRVFCTEYIIIIVGTANQVLDLVELSKSLKINDNNISSKDYQSAGVGWETRDWWDLLLFLYLDWYSLLDCYMSDALVCARVYVF